MVITPVQREALVKKALEASERSIIDLAQPLCDKGIAAEACVIVEKSYEDTAHCLATVADDYNAECMVIGSTGKSWLERLFLGSVSHYLIQHYTHPVIVVPAGSS
mmetsp:Transcript_8917/g.36394  ORF Transcript_8917/g.36394 Transcript_8917/m.36394 type:complete len:105 (-) Transcript_8917:289-603(-)